MAESPLHSLASLHSSYSSSFGGSRPSTASSRAHSDASFVTARPGSSASTRSISHEIDHIKTLISRSAEAPKKPTGSISAQVFRQRSTSSPNVTQAHIYYELDQLKRRIRQEQQQQQQLHQLTRRISQIDPGQESDSDHEEVPDEREVELERAREDVIVVRQRLDGLLERAELRIDRLTTEKEKLEGTCELSKKGWETATAEGRNIAHALQVAQSSIKHLTEKLEDAQNALQEQQVQLSDLQGKKLGSDNAYEQQVASLQVHNTDLEKSLVVAQDERKKILEQLESSSRQHAASEEASKEMLAKLQEQVDREVLKSDRQGVEIQQLRATLVDAEAAMTDAEAARVDAEAASSLAKSDNVTRCKELMGQIEEGKQSLQHVLQEAAANHAEHQQAVQTRDKLKSEIESYQIKLGAALYQQERTEKKLGDVRLKHEENVRILGENQQKQAAEIQQIITESQSQLQERGAAHRSEIEELTKHHGHAVEDLKTSRDSETEQIRREAAEDHARTLDGVVTQHGQAIEDLKATHNTEMVQFRLETTENLRDADKDHNKTVEELATQHRQDLADLKASHSSEKERMRTESEEDRTRTVSDLEKQHHQVLEDMKASHEDETVRICTEASDLARRSGEDHMRALEDLAMQHQQASEEWKTLHRAEMERTRTDMEAEQAKTLGDLTTHHRQALEDLKALHHSEVEQIRLEATSNSRDSEEGHTRLIKDLTTQHERALQDLKASHRSDVEHARSEAMELAEGQLEAVSQANSNAERRLQQHKDAHALELQQLTQTHDASIEAARQEESELHRVLIEAVRREEIDHRSNLTSAHGEEMTVFEAKLSKLELEHQEILKAVRNEHNAAVSALSAKHALESQTARTDEGTRLEELQAVHDAALAAVQDEHSKAIASLGEKHSNAVQAVNERYSSLEASHETEVAAINSQHEQKTAQFLEEHRIELTNEHDRAQRAIAEAAVEHRLALESVTADNQSAVSRLQAELSSTQKDFDRLKTHSVEESILAENEHQRRVENLEAAWSQMAEDALKVHNINLQQAADEAARNSDAATHRFQEQLSERESAEASRVAAFQDAHAQEATCIRENAKTELESAQADLEATKQRMLADHSGEVARLQSENDTHVEETRSAHKAEIDALCDKLEAAELKIKTAIDDHERSTTELRTTHEAELQRLTTEYDQEKNDLQTKSEAEMAVLRKDSVEVLSRVNAIEADYVSKIEDLKLSHDAELTILRNEIAAYTGAIQSKSQDVENLEARLEIARFDAEERAFELEKQHKAALDAAVERNRQNGQAELRSLKKRHQDAVAQVRATAQKQTAAQLTDLENTHQKELEQSLAALSASHHEELTTLRRNISEAHQGEVMRLETEHQTSLAELESRLQDEREAEISSKQADYRSEITALQARLDAALTGQAEAERAVALLRQQVVKTDRRSIESKASAEDQVATLQRENDDLSKQLTLVQTSLRDLQKKGGSGSSTPTSQAGHGELASLKLQLDNFEEERLAMRRTMEKRSVEKLELARQNDFLVKELEVLLAQRTRAKKSTATMVDALVQTESLISEPKVDLASVQVLKAQARTSMRPSTPLSPGQRQAKDEIEMAWTTRSFEDYLDHARTELSQLGSVISANESLFARKISEHVGELQNAKDQLAADYDARIDRLAADKEMMEVMVLSKQQASFAKDRKELVASYNVGSTRSRTSPDIPDRQSVALRTAEERLVADYNKRIFRRKSQIALKHAEEFQNLTREYDRKVAELLDSKSSLEGDLSVDPAKFEQDMGDLQTRSARLSVRSTGANRTDRASPSPMPSDDGLKPRPLRRRSPTSPAEEDRSRRLTRTSTPRTSLSIPRSSSVPRAPIVADHNGTPTPSRKGSEKHPPVPQLSLLRIKTPSDVYSTQARSASSPLAGVSPVKPPMSPRLRRASQQISSPQPPPRLSSRGQGDTAQDLSIEPSQFERQQFPRQSSYVKGAVKPSTATLEPSKPGFLRRVVDRISSDTSRPGTSKLGTSRPGSSSSKTTSTPSFSAKLGHRARSKSTKLSSGMIYYQAPKQSPPAQSYDF